MYYTHGTLDRADALRRDAATLDTLRRDQRTRLIPIADGRVLVDTTVTGDPSLITLAADNAALTDCQRRNGDVFLGLIDGIAHFAIDADSLDASERAALVADAAREATGARGDAVPGDALEAPRSIDFHDLRAVGPRLRADEGALLAYARALIIWHQADRFCIRCATALESANGGHLRQCPDRDCGHSSFPRIDPAVIMLVTDGQADTRKERCLLGRNPAWPDGVFSTLAGFVEPGESLEQAVQREVLEEAGIPTDGVRYIASQPWPFPRSIMLGFEARAMATDITLDPVELADARWFSRDELRHFGNWGDSSDGFKLPRPDSIARFLIDRWMVGRKT